VSTYNLPIQELLLRAPPAFFFLPLLASACVFLLPSAAPHVTEEISSNPMYLKYTLPSLTTITSAQSAIIFAAPFLILLAFKLLSTVSSASSSSPLSTKLSSTPVILLAFSVYFLYILHTFSSNYLSSFLVATSSTPSYCSPCLTQGGGGSLFLPLFSSQNWLGTAHCDLADYIWCPVPHLDTSRIPTTVGGAPRHARANQVSRPEQA
jgi:hypothetical protein